MSSISTLQITWSSLLKHVYNCRPLDSSPRELEKRQTYLLTGKGSSPLNSLNWHHLQTPFSVSYTAVLNPSREGVTTLFPPLPLLFADG